MYLDGEKKGTGDKVNKVMVTTKGRWKVACQSEGVVKNTTNLLFEESWEMTVGEKLKFYGPNRREVVGKTIDGEEKASDCESVEDDETGGADLDSAEKPEFDQAVEPVCWHALPREFYKEITSSYYIKTVIDRTPGNGNFALHCIQTGIGYLGVCFQNEERKAMLTEHLIKEYMILMKTEGNNHYHASYAKHLVGVATSGPGDEDEAAKRKATASAKKAAAAAKKKTTAAAKKKGSICRRGRW
ncbi:unnamed protein product [Prorocentrum cordatum]|uniref:Uncharacterized protein n=1 Tax=Prorocentrum cordatum TaxID=2364126 RepID=A0ABN9Q5W8_9DINO|nr:unnamed protein product [Polarella glacialis]